MTYYLQFKSISMAQWLREDFLNTLSLENVYHHIQKVQTFTVLIFLAIFCLMATFCSSFSDMAESPMFFRSFVACFSLSSVICSSSRRRVRRSSAKREIYSLILRTYYMYLEICSLL